MPVERFDCDPMVFWATLAGVAHSAMAAGTGGRAIHLVAVKVGIVGRRHDERDAKRGPGMSTRWACMECM